MSSFVDFASVKASTTMADAVRFLGLQLKQSGNQWRGPCARCNSGGDRALVITENKGWYCFAAKAGGDVIGLVAHMLNTSAKDAAGQLAEFKGLVQADRTVPSTSPKTRQGSATTVPESETRKGTQKPHLVAYFDKLERDHPMIDALGFSAEFVKKHRIGYAKTGILSGSVAIPFRDENGELLGFIGLLDCKLPADFTSNVIEFSAKKTA